MRILFGMIRRNDTTNIEKYRNGYYIIYDLVVKNTYYNSILIYYIHRNSVYGREMPIPRPYILLLLLIYWYNSERLCMHLYTFTIDKTTSDEALNENVMVERSINGRSGNEGTRVCMQ